VRLAPREALVDIETMLEAEARHGLVVVAPGRPRRLGYRRSMSADQPKNPLHGLTLKTILTTLVQVHGWAWLAERITIRCFANEPSIRSSLKFLRKTPWARAKVESLYLWHLREERRQARQFGSAPSE
jgi:uncharacterized protein (DUF2132 family)